MQVQRPSLGIVPIPSALQGDTERVGERGSNS